MTETVAAGFRLSTGPPAALEAALLARVEELKTDDRLAPVTILVGGTLMKPYLRRRLADELGSVANVRVVTPGELGIALGEPALIASGALPLPILADRVVVQQAVLEADGYFEPVKEAPGLADAAHRLVRDLRQAGVAADRFASAAPLPEHVEPEKHAALAGLLESAAAKAAGRYTADDCLAAADPRRLGARALLVHGLEQPSAILIDALTRIAAHVPVEVLLPQTGDPAVDQACEAFRDWLADQGAHGAEADAPETPQAPLALVSAPDPAREVRAAVRRCLAWAAEGIQFHEMAIAFRHADTYRSLLEQTFREAGIPVYLHDGAPLSERPVGRRAIALLGLVDGDLSRRDVMDFLTDAGIPDAIRDQHPKGLSAARWDSTSRRAGVIQGREQWADRLKAYRDEQEARLARDPTQTWIPDRIADTEALGAFIRDLGDALAARPASASWTDHLAYARGLIGTYVRRAEPLLGALDTLAQLDRVVPEVTFDRFRRAAIATIETVRAPEAFEDREGAFGLRGVQVLDVNSLKWLRFRAVSILGLAERQFPPPPTQDALLLDEERIALNAAFGWRLPLRAWGADPEPLQFALAVHAGSEHVALSYPRTGGSEGRAQLPSPFFRAAAERLAGTRVKADEVDRLPQVERLSSQAIGAPAPDEALTAAEYDRTLIEQEPALGAALAEHGAPNVARARAAWSARHRDPELTPYDGVFEDPAAIAALATHPASRRPLNPGVFETYSACPYKLFLARYLRLDPVEEPEAIERLTPLERGSVIHKVLERLLGELGGRLARPGTREAAAQRERMHAIAAEVCDRAEGRGLTGYPALWAIDRPGILEDLDGWLDREFEEPPDLFDHGAYEVRFGAPYPGEESSSPLSIDTPLQLAVGDATFEIQGRIDRIDWREGPAPGLRVIDYKTGGGYGAPKPHDLADGQSMQLPIYLLAAAKVAGVPWEAGEAELYYCTRKGDYKRIPFTGADLAEQWDLFEGVVSETLEGLREGDFHLDPGPDSKHCKWCDFARLCPADRAAIMGPKLAGDDEEAEDG